jgi:hypothetical protein
MFDIHRKCYFRIFDILKFCFYVFFIINSNASQSPTSVCDDYGPVLLELLGSLVVERSLSRKELDFKPLWATAGFGHSCVVEKSQGTLASRSFPSCSEAVCTVAPVVCSILQANATVLDYC